MAYVEADFRAAIAKGPAFDYSFTGDISLFDKLWQQSWAEFSKDALCKRLADAAPRPETTADSDNRKRDKADTEKRLGVQEPGNGTTVLFNETGERLATGYVQILYGDHGDYFELLERQINWPLFTQHKLKGPGRHYHEHKTADGKIQLYDQFHTVADEPNPPPGPKSKANNRKEGYAAYRPGVFYMPTEAVARVDHCNGATTGGEKRAAVDTGADAKRPRVAGSDVSSHDESLRNAMKQGRAFDYSFTGDFELFNKLWHLSWDEFGDKARCTRLDAVAARSETTADSDNRKRDKAETEKRLGLQEPGNPDTVLYNDKDQVLATGYVQILYGDHGDYFELLEKQINWPLFTQHKLKGPGRHYHEHRTEDNAIQLYDQFATVADEPNPPPGPKSKANNRKEGYAAYRPGVFYMPTDVVSKAVKK